jgi:hypothetical protein
MSDPLISRLRETLRPDPTPAKRGFGALTCPCCGEEGRITLDLDEVTGDQAFTCPGCENTFGVAVVRVMITRWQRVLDWIDACPAVE